MIMVERPEVLVGQGWCDAHSHYQGLLTRITVDGLITLYAHNIGLNWNDPYLVIKGGNHPVRIQKSYPPTIKHMLDEDIIRSHKKTATDISQENLDMYLRTRIIEDVRTTQVRFRDANAFYLADLQKSGDTWSYILSMYMIAGKRS